MTKDYVKVWACNVHDQNMEPSMENLSVWKMTVRVRSGAQVRSAVHIIQGTEKSGGTNWW